MAKKQPAKKAAPSHAKPQSGKKKAGKPAPLTASSPVSADGGGADSSLLGLPDQQRILDVFASVFSAELASGSFAATLQGIKQALFERDFAAAFGAEDSLRVYAARYSPTRALCYAEALAGIAGHLDGLLSRGDDRRLLLDAGLDGGAGAGAGLLRALAIGGGTAEAAAFAAFLRQRPGGTACSVVLLDSGPWGPVVGSLVAGLTTPPTLSKYASAEIQAANCALVEPPRFRTTFVQKDALSLDGNGYDELLPGESPCLVTLLFALNELFTGGGIGKTTAFLLTLSASMPSGSLLLVIDSPGSYSETAVGKESKRYPMAWLLDKVLSSAEDCEWDKLESHDSIWFRLPVGLRYPIPLENMRYQMHLYRVRKTIISKG